MGQAVFTPCCLTWGQTMGEVMKVMVTSFKRSHACMATLSAPNPAAGHQQPMPLLEMPGHSQTSLGQSLVGSLLLSPRSWCTRFCLCPPRVYFPDLCKFWQLYGGVNGDLQDVLCHTQLCCTQSPCPCGSPLLTRTSTGGAQTLFCLSLCGVPGSWCAQGLFEPSERLWQEWGLMLNTNLPLLPSWAALVAQTVKASAYNGGDPGLIPGSGRSSGEGNGNPLQYSLENLMDREPGGLQSMESQRVRHDWATSLHFTILLGLLLCPWTWDIASHLLHCLPSYWGFSDLGCGVSPHSQSSKAQPPLLTLDVGNLFTAAPAKHRHQSWPWMWGSFSSQLAAPAPQLQW